MDSINFGPMKNNILDFIGMDLVDGEGTQMHSGLRNVSASYALNRVGVTRGHNG